MDIHDGSMIWKILLVTVMFVALYFASTLIVRRRHHKAPPPIKGCKECSVSGSECGGFENPDKPGLLPILETTFNLRECAKQLILLEDHLANPRKRCGDCCRKHFLTIEALAEEGNTIDKESRYNKQCSALADDIRECQKRWISGENPAELSQRLRVIRKPLMAYYFDKFE